MRDMQFHAENDRHRVRARQLHRRVERAVLLRLIEAEDIKILSPQTRKIGLRETDDLRASSRRLAEELLGPAPLLRLRGRYRAQLVAKTSEPRRVAARAAQLLAAAAPAMRKAGVTAVVDVDPQSL